MSASSKKKLRKAEVEAKLTEKQLAEQKEAKKLSIYSIIFGVVIAAMLIIAVTTAVYRGVTNSGVLERSTAVTVGEHKVSGAELNIYYIESVNYFMQQYGSYASLFGLDTTKSLDEQVIDEETGLTWADDFLTSAKDTLRSTYAMVDLAKAEGFELTEADINNIEVTVNNMSAYAVRYGYPDVDTYLQANYGRGCTVELFKAYLTNTTLARAYVNHYTESLSYTDADLRALEAENFDAYSAFTYSTYNLTANMFLSGGTKGEDGTTTYTDEERATALANAEEAAKVLTAEDIKTVADLNAAIAALPVNADAASASSTTNTDYAYSSVSANIRDWLADDARKDGDLTYIANTSTSTAEDGTETTTTNGYTVVMFHSVNDNTFPLANVRHILIAYEGGTQDESGNTTYNLSEKQAAETAAANLLDTWEINGATEEAFAALATEHSDDTGSTANGGLYEDIYPGQMVPAFNDWCFDESREIGDVGLVHTDYGCHAMYFVGDSETTYRDFLLTNTLKNQDTNDWYNAALEKVTVTDVNLKHISTDLVLSN